MSHPERIVPDRTEPGVVALHLKRYAFALPYCDGKEVLDAGCGVGYGTAFLAERARRVVGVDADTETIAYARTRYAGPNVVFEQGDLLLDEPPGGPFDVICAFEAIEHLADERAFLDRMCAALEPDGVFLVSTPRAERTTRTPDNPFHHVEFAREDFEELLRGAFGQVEIYGQRRLQTRRHRLLRRLDVLGLRRRVPALGRIAPLVGTPPTTELTLDDVVISPEHVERASELVAVCRRPRSR